MNQPIICNESDCLGKSYPQIGQVSESARISIAQPGHSLVFIIVTSLSLNYFGESFTQILVKFNMNHLHNQFLYL